MKVYFILICGLGLAGVALGGPNRNPAPAMRVSQPARMQVSQPARMGISQPAKMGVSQPGRMIVGKPTTVGQPAGRGKRVAAINVVNRPTDVANTGSQLQPHRQGGRNVVNGPQTQVRPAFSIANGPQTQGGPKRRNVVNGPQTHGGPQLQKVVNGQQTDSASNGGELPPPTMETSAGQPVNVANNSQNERPPEVMSASYPANEQNKSASESPPAVQFKQNRRIQGSDGWVDSSYEVFRNYRSRWHDRDWWRSHYSRVAFGVGGWYYWSAGYWFPAWGYDPNAHYVYDGPIYAYNGSPPDQVIVDVQEALQKQGYYRGEVDGLLGPPTRAALADYQRDHRLYTTSAIDSPTLEILGMK